MNFILTNQAIVLVVFLWLIHKSTIGRNWARIVLVALFFGGVLIAPRQTLDAITRSAVGGTVLVLQMLLQLVAYFLMFSRPGTLWYHPKKPTAVP